MSWFYRSFLRPMLFTQDPEAIHALTMDLLGRVSRVPLGVECLESFFGAPSLPVRAFGLRFPNPLGLAAGMDKEAEAVPAWAALGFGFSELGAVTWHAQPGNPKPRLFRAVAEEAVVNRMGFNNAGAAAVAARLGTWRWGGLWPNHPVGINLGKSKVTPLEQAAEDYAASFRHLWSLADFFVVNVSSPNTPNLRRLQDKAALDEILAALQAVNAELAGAPASDASRSTGGDRRKPILVKVAPDLSFPALDEIVGLVGPREVAGLVATNTTTERPTTHDLRSQAAYREAGGLSGRPLRARSTEVIRHLYRQTGGQVPIIGVGGIFNAADAWEKITAGATLVQVYTGFVFEGPGLPRQILTGLEQRLADCGWSSIAEAVGRQASL